MSVQYPVDLVVDAKNVLGEGPLWDPNLQALYWVDIYQKRIHRWVPSNPDIDTFYFPLPITALGLRQTGGLVLATRDGFALWDFSRLCWLGDPEADKPESRFNDGSVDRQGRFWAGTMTEEGAASSLYRLTPDKKITTMETGLTISNGLGWSLDQTTFYLTDTKRNYIYQFDFDPLSGCIANRRILIDVPREHGSPDGLAIDAQSFLWSCCWGGWKILRIDPDGKIEREIRVPVEFPASCVFGGPDLADLYITSARFPVKDPQIQPNAGGIFHIHTEFHGLPPSTFQG
jgi:L-arabinonolactonase